MKSTAQIEYIPSNQRGVTDKDWLLSRHSFSFGGHYNLERLNFGTLRVFNDDLLKPGKGFELHHHENMEIITIPLEGAVKHKDSKGNEGIIQPGQVQRMSAGTGIEHSEMNASQVDLAHFLQIWIFPAERDLQPSYEQKSYAPEQLKNQLFPIVSSHPSESSLLIHQDAALFLGHLDEGMKIAHVIRNKKHGAFVYVIDGEIQLSGQPMQKGDSAQVMQQDQLDISAVSSSKILLIEVSIHTL